MTRPEYGKPETWPQHRIPPAKDWTKIPGWEPRPDGVDERILLTQRYAVWGSTDGGPVSDAYGAWDWMCFICNRGNGTYPIGRDAAFEHAHAHLREHHDGRDA